MRIRNFFSFSLSQKNKRQKIKNKSIYLGTMQLSDGEASKHEQENKQNTNIKT